jgi:YaiO family outer membrane protein
MYSPLTTLKAGRSFAGILMFAFNATQVFADAQAALPPLFEKYGFFEVGGGYAHMTENNPNWDDQYIRGSWQFTATDHIFGEISRQNHFGGVGVYFGSTYTRDFNQNWYGSLNIGTSVGGFFLPEARVDANVYRKWLEKKNLVTGIGFTHYRAKNIYYDQTLLFDIVYYFDKPWILELGGRLNQSNPGGINSGRGFAALTYGRNKERYITVRYEEGTEAYQLIGPSTAISDFSSSEVGLTWRQWMSKDYGFNLVANYYSNPSYSRYGVMLGLFFDF